MQRIFDRFGIKPTYVVDYPVVSSAGGSERLREFWHDGRCSIGAHLHPWVTPPFTEDVNGRNSFACNLPESLQLAKIRELTSAIEHCFGARPTIFKAGRYGLGAATVRVLDELGYEVDMSVTPRLDFTQVGGPSFTRFDPCPFFLTDRLLEIPARSISPDGCARPARGCIAPLRPDRSRSSGRWACCDGTGMLNRIMLSPEGNTFEEMGDITSVLVADGCRTFTLSFHSPSVEPGHTPYVRTMQDLERFLATIERFCEFFFGRPAAGFPRRPSAFRSQALAGSGAALHEGARAFRPSTRTRPSRSSKTA